MSIFKAEQLDLVRTSISDHEAQFRNEVAEPLSRLLKLSYPSEITNLLGSYEALDDAIGNIEVAGPYSLDDDWNPFIKRIILDRRRRTAAHAEAQRSRTHHAELISKAEAELTPFTDFMKLDWFSKAQPVRMPRLADFVTLEHALSRFHETHPSPQELYDEKFHILHAPQCFWTDIAYYRAIGELRGVPASIAYVDIDNFKAFNTAHTETIVDREVLPRFMRAVDAFCFGHGRAYRFGGDEYVLLLPNMNREYTVTFLDSLRERIATIAYPGIPQQTTVSIGFCFLEADCFLTDQECLGKANAAKQHAKHNGKNCISSFDGNDLSEETLKLFGTKPAEKSALKRTSRKP